MAFSKFVKQKLFSIIDLMDSDPSDFVQKPKKDFVRNRKIRFSDVLKCLISLESKSMNQELLRYFSFSDQTPSASAFIQQRKKIKLDAFYHLFYELNKAFEQKNTMVTHFWPAMVRISLSLFPKTVILLTRHHVSVRTARIITRCVSMHCLIWLTSGIWMSSWNHRKMQMNGLPCAPC